MLPRLLLTMAVLLGGCVVDEPAVTRRGTSPERAAADYRRARGEILQELERYYKDFSARNWEAYASHFWPGATITTIWSPPGEGESSVVATSLDEFIAGAGEGPGSTQIFEERLSGAEVRVEGSLALVWATYRARIGERGNVSTLSGTDAFTLMKLDGRWKITSLAFAAD